MEADVVVIMLTSILVGKRTIRESLKRRMKT
jgi:hypothetical protein